MSRILLNSRYGAYWKSIKSLNPLQYCRKHSTYYTRYCPLCSIENQNKRFMKKLILFMFKVIAVIAITIWFFFVVVSCSPKTVCPTYGHQGKYEFQKYQYKMNKVRR